MKEVEEKKLKKLHKVHKIHTHTIKKLLSLFIVNSNMASKQKTRYKEEYYRN